MNFLVAIFKLFVITYTLKLVLVGGDVVFFAHCVVNCRFLNT